MEKKLGIGTELFSTTGWRNGKFTREFSLTCGKTPFRYGLDYIDYFKIKITKGEIKIIEQEDKHGDTHFYIAPSEDFSFLETHTLSKKNKRIEIRS